MTKGKKYNLGSGRTGLNGYINYDTELDLNENFVLDNADEIVLDSVLEHLKNPAKTLVNIHKNLNKDGVVKITLPSWFHGCNINHRNFGYDKNFFYPFVATGVNSSEHVKLFKVKKAHYRNFRLKDFLGKLRDIILSLIYVDIYFELEKEEVDTTNLGIKEKLEMYCGQD